MAKLSSSHSTISDFVCHGVLLPFLLLSHISFQVAWCGSIVKFLPGFEGPLPFVLETGYIGVGESEDVQAFYYFFESENNPKDDPLMLWLTGGQGCSVLSGIAFEIGPFAFKIEEYNGSRPNLVLRPQSWTKISSIIFVDMPVSTGFTYARTESAAERNDWNVVHQVHEFLRKWLIDHPNFLSNEVYIGGDSYSGIPVPVIVQEISQGNEKGLQPWINIQGYVLGNPATSQSYPNSRIPFAHGMGLIPDELYESLQKNCKGEYVNVDATNVLCSKDIDSFNEAILGLDQGEILDPYCGPEDNVEASWRRSLIEKFPKKNYLNIHLKLPPLSCRIYPYFLCVYWANDDNVRSALHIHKGSIGKWIRCNHNIPYKQEISSSVEYHVNLSRKGYRSLIYSGDHDMLVPFLDTQAWIRSLNYSIVDDWRQWHTNGQVAGYTRTYSNRMTFATVKGGGHTAPESKPEECFVMYRNEKGLQPWINVQGYVMGNPLTSRSYPNYGIPFAHGMGLISDELYESLQKNCEGEYVNVDATNVLCSKDVDSFNENYPYFLCGYWANDDNVRSALHIRKVYKDLLHPYDISNCEGKSLVLVLIALVGQGGGHTAPESKPEECFVMYSRWISNTPL